MNDIPVPRSTDELTLEWMTAALGSGMGAAASTLRSVHTEPLGVGQGFAAELARVFLGYAGEAPGAPRTLVAKLASKAAGTRALLNEFDGYGREVRFYAEVAECAGVSVPRCYYGARDASSGDFVLLLEDLAPAESGDQVRGATREQAAAVVRSIAELHARFWDSEELRKTAWCWVENDAARVMELWGEGLPLFRESARDRHPLLVEMAEQIYAMLPYLSLEVTPSMRRLTLIHGDLRFGNVFFPNPAGGRFALIDWQSAAAGRGSQDIAYWLSLSLDVEERRACERDLLRLYHSTLKEKGVKRYPFWRLKLEYRLTLLGVLGGLAGVSEHLEVLVEHGQELSEVMRDRIEAALIDWKLPRLLRSWMPWYRLRAVLDRMRGVSRPGSQIDP
jgi:thiamine kinase-like enzyme